MRKHAVNPTTIRCCICAELYEPSARGAGVEVGTPRRFCPACFSEILRVNGIREDDHYDDLDTTSIDEAFEEDEC